MTLMPRPKRDQAKVKRYKRTTYDDFNDFMTWIDREVVLEPRNTEHAKRNKKALLVAWWFIENVHPEDPERSDLFFRVREIVREAQN